MHPNDPTIIALISGVIIPFIVGLITKDVTNPVLKNTIASVLSTLAGVLPTVVLSPGADWKTYVYNVAIAFFTTYTTHKTGVTEPLERATAAVGFQTKHAIPKSKHGQTCVAHGIRLDHPVDTTITGSAAQVQPGGIQPDGPQARASAVVKSARPSTAAKKAAAKRAPRKVADKPLRVRKAAPPAHKSSSPPNPPEEPQS